MNLRHLLLLLGGGVLGCRDGARPLAPRSDEPRFSHTSGHGLEGKIAFTSNRYGSFHIFVMNADGSNVIQLTNGATNDFGPIWSPDGKRIAFGGCMASCEVFVMNADGSGLTQLTNEGAFPGAWSPDGTRIAFGSDAGGDGEVFIMNTDGSGVTQVTDNDVFFDYPDAWSPDGARIAFVSNRDGNPELYSINVDGSGVARLTDTPAEETRPAWSPVGARIAFTSDHDGDYDLFVMNADGSDVTQLTQNDGSADDYAAWSPDGTQIAFESNRDGDMEIFVMNADGSGVIPLTTNDGIDDRGAAWIQQFAPANDNFASASLISSLPLDDVVDLTVAGHEAGEPTPSCGLFYGPVSRTAWYRFTPTETRSISARIANAQFGTVVAAYSGTSLGELRELDCAVFGATATFRAEANTTYYFQVGGLFDQGGLVRFRLEVTPPPVAQFGFNPSDPSSVDGVQFLDFSYDPGDAGIQSRRWAFGDGTTTITTDCCVSHRYATDGNYTAELTVTTVDGRTGSISQTLVVRTHDVAITKFSVPNAASAGQTRSIVVGINSRRYGEVVDVQLFKSVPGGFVFVGTQTQSVPVRPANRTTDFSFSYTFTVDDARVGKVTFRAVANVLGARDPLPADNEAIATPTKVNR
jgi:Tol biopolymer transport system component/PKD repeat protein